MWVPPHPASTSEKGPRRCDTVITPVPGTSPRHCQRGRDGAAQPYETAENPLPGIQALRERHEKRRTSWSICALAFSQLPGSVTHPARQRFSRQSQPSRLGTLAAELGGSYKSPRGPYKSPEVPPASWRPSSAFGALGDAEKKTPGGKTQPLTCAILAEIARPRVPHFGVCRLTSVHGCQRPHKSKGPHGHAHGAAKISSHTVLRAHWARARLGARGLLLTPAELAPDIRKPLRLLGPHQDGFLPSASSQPSLPKGQSWTLIPFPILPRCPSTAWCWC